MHFLQFLQNNSSGSKFTWNRLCKCRIWTALIFGVWPCCSPQGNIKHSTAERSTRTVLAAPCREKVNSECTGECLKAGPLKCYMGSSCRRCIHGHNIQHLLAQIYVTTQYFRFYHDNLLEICTLGWKKYFFELCATSEEFHMSGVCCIKGVCLPMWFDPGSRRTRGQGVDQSTSPLQGVTVGGERERRKWSQREIGKESLIIIVTVSHTLATQCHHQSVLALGVWRVTLCLSFHPSISPCFSLAHIHKHVLSLSHSQPPIIFVYAKGIFIMLSSSLLSITASPVILVLARGSEMSSFLVQPSPHPVPGSRTHSVAAVKNFDIRQEPAPHEWLMRECWLITQGKEPIFWPET